MSHQFADRPDVLARRKAAITGLLNSSYLATIYATMTDAELADHLLHDVWGEMVR